MKKDIEIPKVEQIGVAVVQEIDELNNATWQVYIINYKEVDIKNVLVSTDGYGLKDKEAVKTSTLRYFLGDLPPKSFKKLEIITDELVDLTNQYWVSFYMEDKIYDRKYIFVPESIHESNLIDLPLIGKKGIIIK